MSPSPKKIKHEMQKEVRMLGKSPSASSLKSRAPFPLPLNRSKKTVKLKKGISKRTSPGIPITTEATPAFAHKEGVRWNAITIKKTLNQDKIMNRHMAKGDKKGAMRKGKK